MNHKNNLLTDHFERLRELIPEVYTHPSFQEESNDNNALFKVLKRTLGIIEAIYLQDQSNLRPAAMEEYATIIRELKAMGYGYQGNQELLEKAAGQMIMKAKKPMEKAKGKRSSKSDEDRKAM